MAFKEKFSDCQIADAIDATDGIIYEVLAFLHGTADATGRKTEKGLPVRMTRSGLSKRIKDSEYLSGIYQEAQENIKDQAEKRIIEAIQLGGSGGIRAATWYLERKAADRGYSLNSNMAQEIASAIVTRYELPAPISDAAEWRGTAETVMAENAPHWSETARASIHATKAISKRAKH